MNSIQRATKTLNLFLAMAMMGCVSVALEKTEVTRANGTRYSSPPAPFSKFAADHVDAAWRNPKNGNSISYLSDCNSASDPSHEAIRTGVVTGVRNLKIEKSEMIKFNNRKALHSTLEGNIDGVDTQFEILILKKNSCIYVLTYVGLQGSFQADKGKFATFIKGFWAP